MRCSACQPDQLRALPRVTYTHPELAQVGLTELKPAPPGIRWRSCAGRSLRTTCAIAEGDTVGLVKLVVAHNRVLGAGILAPNAGEMIALWTLAIAQRMKLRALASLILPYPYARRGR